MVEGGKGVKWGTSVIVSIIITKKKNMDPAILIWKWEGQLSLLYRITHSQKCCFPPLKLWTLIARD